MSGGQTFTFEPKPGEKSRSLCNLRAAEFVTCLNAKGYRAALHLRDWSPGVFRVVSGPPATAGWLIEVYFRPADEAAFRDAPGEAATSSVTEAVA